MAFTYNYYSESPDVTKKRKEAENASTYLPSTDVMNAKAKLDAFNKTSVAPWTGGNYGASLQNAINKITNRPQFTYDLNGDALYQQYKNNYINQGRLAMQDTIGQASALTGGYGNSYAAMVGNQAYQGYLQKVNDIVPELYQLAYDKYNQEGQELYNQANLYNNMYNTEYGQYRDKVSDWQNEYQRLQNAYMNQANMDYNQFADRRDYAYSAYKDAANTDYGMYKDAYNRAASEYERNVDEEHWNKEYNYNISSGSSSGKKPDYSEWSNSDWMEYITSISHDEGEDAALEEIDRLTKEGYIRGSLVNALTLGVRSAKH